MAMISPSFVDFVTQLETALAGKTIGGTQTRLIADAFFCHLTPAAKQTWKEVTRNSYGQLPSSVRPKPFMVFGKRVVELLQGSEIPTAEKCGELWEQYESNSQNAWLLLDEYFPEERANEIKRQVRLTLATNLAKQWSSARQSNGQSSSQQN